MSRRLPQRSGTFVAALACAQLAGLAGAQGPDHPSVRIVRTDVPPIIDGRLDDACWKTAPSIGPLVQMSPLIAVPATEEADVRLLYDAEHLYIGVRCYDKEPDKIVATQMKRDVDLDPDDRVEIVIDTFHDHRNAYFFEMSPVGSKGDALLSRDGEGFNKPWDGIWEGKATIDRLGWSCELAIPFQTLGFDPQNDTWGFNINRVIKRKLESDRWSGLTRDHQVYQPSASGDITGLVGLKQGIGLDVLPHFTSDWTKGLADPESETLRGRPGLDVFYKITPSLQASLTINTDFAETEADDRLINLTRFPLFRSEKRDFFLQDASIFEFADLDQSLVPFFSRRIGLDANGKPVPILAGGKLTGRADQWNIGVLDVETDSTNELERQNLLVARVSRNVGEQSTVGGIFTHGDPSGATENQLYGADANFRTSSFLGDKNFTATAWALKTSGADSPESTGDDAAFGTSIGYPNDLWSWKLSAREIESNFDPALGFVPRTGVREYSGQLDFQPRIDTDIRRLELEARGDWVTGVDDRLQTFTGRIRPLGIVWDSGDELRFLVLPTRDRPDTDFEIREGVTIPPGDYQFVRWRVETESALKRPVSGSLGVEAGDFYDGRRTEYDATLAWRPGPHFTGALEYERNDVDLPEGTFTTHIGRARLDFAFTPDVTWSNFVQLDNESDTLGLNSRLRWIVEPGRDLFLVFNEGLAREDGSLVATEQQVAFKIVYTLRF